METGRDRACAARIRAYAQSCPARGAAELRASRPRALLSDDLRAGAEVEFDVIDEGGPAGRRSTTTSRASTPSSNRAGSGCASCRPAPPPAANRRGRVQLRMNGLRGEQAEPALQAMLERLYEDATSFGFPEERFERVLGGRGHALPRRCARDCSRRSTGPRWTPSAWSLAAAYRSYAASFAEAPREAVYPESGDGEPALLCAPATTPCR